MIVKFHARGTGGGSGPIDYLLGKERDREGSKLDRGNPETIQAIIDSSPYAKKYTSGVLSFKESDLPQADKDKIMSSFEKALLPGLDKDQYACLWVEHRDKNRLELNFVVPNIELQTGKRLQPYFERADKPRINAWKICANDNYKLHDPDDPKNKRELVTPNDLPSKKQEASHAITNGLLHLAEAGQLKNRADVIGSLENAGFTIARTTTKSISIADPDGGRNIRLKGSLYEQDFKFGTELRTDIEAASQHYRKESANRVREAREVYQRGIEIKREENQRRHPRPTITTDPIRTQDVAMAATDSHYSATRQLGRDLDTGRDDNQELENHQSAKPNPERTGDKRWEDSIHPMRGQSPLMLEDRYRRERLRKKRPIPNTRGLLNDRTRNPIIERLEKLGDTVQRAAESFRTSVRELEKHVRTYIEREQDVSKASSVLKQSSTELEQTTREGIKTLEKERQQESKRSSLSKIR